MADASAARVRPVDAAGLVLIRAGAHGPEVLLGRRHARVSFLPDIYVFPGGRVDPADARPTGFPERLAPAVEAQLAQSCSKRPPAAFPRAALRETLEETGLLLGTPASRQLDPRKHAGPWREFAERGLVPVFEALDLVCRAITPTSSHRRYHTRFFLADGTAAMGEIGGSGELEDLRWFPIAETAGLGLVDVTQVVLGEALRRWRRLVPAGAPAPLLCYRRGEVCLYRPGDRVLVGEARVLAAAALG